MNNVKCWQILTAKNEQQAMPCSKYIVFGASTENEAIKHCYTLILTGNLRPTCSLSSYAVPDYTTAIEL